MKKTAKKAKTPELSMGSRRILLMEWLIAHNLRLWGLGVNLDGAAELATAELGHDVKAATLGRASRFLKKIGAMKYKIARRRQLGGPASLPADKWAAIGLIIRGMNCKLCVEHWTLPAVQRRLAREKLRVSEDAVREGLRIAGFDVDEAAYQRVVFKGNR